MSAEDTSLRVEATPARNKPGKFTVRAVNGVGDVHLDTIDLASDTSRSRFVGKAMRAAFPKTAPDDWPEGVREELEKQLLNLAKVPPGDPDPPKVNDKAEAEDPRVKALAEMPVDVRTEAVAMLEDPDLLRDIKRDIYTAGIVGESEFALCVYMIGTSAQLDRPLAGIARGPSSSGKSYVIERVSSLFPPEVVLHATSLTPNALFYFQPGILRHRFVVAGERSRIEDDERAEATRALREMIESGRLTKAIPMKDETGKMTTTVIEQEGPIAYVESTTAAHIDPEDANRCLLLATDERESQTKRILTATAEAATGKTRGGRCAHSRSPPRTTTHDPTCRRGNPLRQRDRQTLPVRPD